MKNLKVSIITVCYNSEATIGRTIESVLNQTWENIEYIVIDGNSTDGTIKTVKEYEAAFDGRLRYVSEPDSGIYDAMNKGIRMATGRLIGIINSDDYYEAQAVERMTEAMGVDRYQILYGFTRSLRNGEECSVGRQSHVFLRENMIGHPSCFVTREVYEDFGCFDLQYVSVADYDFMLRMSEIPEVKFYPVDFLIANFTLGGMSASEAAWLDLLKLRKQHGIISEKAYKREILKSRVYRLYQRCLKLKRPVTSEKQV